MKIGIFLGYGPHVVLSKEGLGRYVGALLKGFTWEGHTAVIVCSYGQRASVQRLFNDFGLSDAGITLLSTEKEMPLWLLYKKAMLRKPAGLLRKCLKFLAGQIRTGVLLLLRKSAETTSILYAVFLCALLSVVSFPVAMLAVFFLTVLFVARCGCRFVFSKLKYRIRERLLGESGADGIGALLFQFMMDAEVERLVKIANRAKERPDVWFVPSLFWPQTVSIRSAPVVFNAPDMIPEEYPIGFSGRSMDAKMHICRRTLYQGKWFITYGAYVRDSLLITENRIPSGQTVGIVNANNDMSPYLFIDPMVNRQNHTDKDFSEAFAYSFLAVYKKTQYIFFPSQTRVNKNILALIKAYEYLLRKKFMHIKLFLTGQIEPCSALERYIKTHHLEREVISCYDVSAQHLAALYRCAELVVNPTLYEGGFPFTFGEGMSVGTPSVMSDIPQTRAVLAPAGLEEILFDPYDWRAMAEKIEYGLKNRRALYEKELPLYEKLAARTPEVVAAEYVEAFRYFIERDANARGGCTV